MRRTPLALTSAVVLLALGLTGCGGGDDSDGDAGDAPSSETSAADETSAPAETDTPAQTEDPADGGGLSKEAFVAQANAICAAGSEAIEAGSALVDPDNPETINTFATSVLVPSVRAQIAAIRALSIPGADEEALTGVLDDADAALDEIEADPSLLTSGEDPFAAVNEALNAYGLTECGS